MVTTGQVVGPDEAFGLTRQGYRLSGPDRFGGYIVVATPAETGMGRGGGGLAPARSQVPYGGETTSTGLSETSSLSELPQDVRERYLAYLDEIGGLPAGFTPEEAAGLQIGPEEASKLSRFAIDPTIGAANRARSELGALYAASGGFNPGMNATMQEIQREQGRQAAEASLRSRLAVSEVNRRATELAANARIGGEQFRAGQKANLLASFPERKGKATTTSTGKTTSLPTYPSGEPFPSTALAPGMELNAVGVPRPAKTPKPSLFAGLSPEARTAAKKKSWGGLAYAY